MDCFRVDLVPTHRILLNGSADQISTGFGPRQIEVEIRYDGCQLRMRVRDDGKGIDPQVLSDHGREGRFGLRGMRERAKVIGGKLTLWSKLDSGTEVELSTPASHAYTAPADVQRSWLAEKFAKFSCKDTGLKS